MRYDKVKDSKNFEDRTGRTLMESRLRDPADSLTDAERELMKKNKWNVDDIIIMRRLDNVNSGRAPARFPDKNSQKNWHYE